MSQRNFLVLLSITVFVSACGKAPLPAGGSQSTSSLSETNPYANEPFTLGVLGDSIALGMDLAEVDTGRNWASGERLPNSILNMFKNKFAERGWRVTINSKNLAVIGQDVLGSKSSFLAKASELATHNPHFVTIQIGANDICDGNLGTAGGVAAFRERISTALQTLKNSSRPPKLITLLSIPNILQLKQIDGIGDRLYCQAIWLYACPNFKIGEAEFTKQWMDGNNALKEAAALAGAAVQYDNGVQADAAFTLADVTPNDCFHPTFQGHGKMAAKVWSSFEGYTGPLFVKDR